MAAFAAPLRSAPLLLALSAALLMVAIGCRGRGDGIADPGPSPSVESAAPQPPPQPVRPAYHAGTWYPSDPAKLRSLVAGFIESAAVKPRPGVIALVAPHAGYVYSGPVAGKAYAAVRGESYDAVIVAGISHRGELDGISVEPKGSYSTPLGAVPIDEEIARSMLSNPTGRIKHQERADSREIRGDLWTEHGIELHLPFLQVALAGAFKIVPILVRARDPDDYAILADAIEWAVEGSGKKTLLVASTDLSHFPASADAESSDQAIMVAAASLDPERLLAADKRLMSSGVAGLECTMCGLDAVVPLLMAAKQLGGAKVEVLDVRNSHQTAGADPRRVVGYGAMAVMSGQSAGLTLETKRGLIAIAREAAQASLEAREFKLPSELNSQMKGKGGAFVTLRRGEELRGCIGSYNESGTMELWQVVSRMAVSATTDSRFRFEPVTASEMRDAISLEVSVLSPFTRVEDPKKIELGVHGVSLVWDNERYSVYLPQVATETGWDLQTFLSQLCVKGGLRQDAWKDRKRMKFDLFTAEVFHE